jgi:threonine dehydratase
MNLISMEDIRSASSAIADIAVRTPLLACPWAGGDAALWLKPENFQVTGSFKIRGAYTAISRLPADRRRIGVITYSSGNHAQAVAYAARAFGVPCTVVMPDDARAVKVAATRALGAEIVRVPAAERRRRAEELSAAHGQAMIPPYDHPDVIAGQGTVGLEIVQDQPMVDVVLVPVGGGGLAAGVASAVKALRPSAAVFGIEPELAADAAESLRTGSLATWPMTLTGRTAADGLRTNLSELTLAHLANRLDGIVTVSENEIDAAMGELTRMAHIIAEPSGAVSMAGYLFHRDEFPPGTTVAIISGGNIDSGLLMSVIADWPTAKAPAKAEQG